MKHYSILFNFLLFLTIISCNTKENVNDRKISYDPEIKEIIDRRTGVPIKQLTNYWGHSHHFYFTNPGWYSNGFKLLFSSDRDNRTNLFSVDLSNFSIQQLTDLEPVPLPREVEFFRAFKNPVKDQAFFWHDRELKAIDLIT